MNFTDKNTEARVGLEPEIFSTKLGCDSQIN